MLLVEECRAYALFLHYVLSFAMCSLNFCRRFYFTILRTLISLSFLCFKMLTHRNSFQTWNLHNFPSSNRLLDFWDFFVYAHLLLNDRLRHSFLTSGKRFIETVQFVDRSLIIFFTNRHNAVHSLFSTSLVCSSLLNFHSPGFHN